jgi:hypothetical protein
MNDNTAKQGAKITLEQAITKASRKIQQLTELKIAGVVGVALEETGNYCLKIEVIERTGIPDTMDLLGLYEINLDPVGNLIGYSRLGIRKRGEEYHNLN